MTWAFDTLVPAVEWSLTMSELSLKRQVSPILEVKKKSMVANVVPDNHST